FDVFFLFFFFSSRRRHTRFSRDWSSDVCSSDLMGMSGLPEGRVAPRLSPLIALAAGFFLPPGLRLGFALAMRGPRFLSSLRASRSEERRVGKECSGWWGRYDLKTNGQGKIVR